MSEPQFTWVDVYTKFADRLMDFKNDRKTLIDGLQHVFWEIGMKFPHLDSVPVL
ncbi:MAG: hypothetical protein SPK50_03700 [Mobiluncus porci]|uniref:hypothetical protein n=1 Tax=Mobiluncus TaxID=2050 RepID=UPI0023F58498|nr:MULTISPECIES: hypothetical protein [Mobiluncus]MCI6584342.1 hypothetical protein [Mobiluncus sp.]MDD7540659.1 hypothetical protein [Mobiluncus porci]MDY5748222.1 hypothetical protein [Mobiluncus porci]